MKIFSETVKKDVSHFGSNEIFFDIETTGLNREKNNIYIIGVAYKESSNLKIQQFFSESSKDEKEIIHQFDKTIKNFEKVITFNGDAFDIPFVNYRSKLNNLDICLDNLLSLDIYKIAKTNKDFLNLTNLKQKTIETSLNIFREDKYNGQDCIGFYYEWKKTKNNDLLNILLKHNFDDLLYLPDVYKISEVIDNKKTIIIDNNKLITIANINFSKDFLNIFGTQKNMDCYNIYSNEIIFISDNNKFEIKIPLLKGKMDTGEKLYYQSLNNTIIPFKIDKSILTDSIKKYISIVLKMTS